MLLYEVIPMAKIYLNYEEQCNLVKESLAGNENALNTILQFSYPLIAKLASSYMKYGCEFEDLIQEGYIAIYTALPKYRPEMNTKFSTYALWHVRKRLNLYAQSQRMIQIPTLKLEKLKNYNLLLNELEPSVLGNNTEMAALLDMSEKEYLTLKNVPTSYLKFDPETERQEDAAEDIEDIILLKILVEDALEHLSEKERYVICRYYQVGGFSEKSTLEDISKDLNCSKEWVRQLLIVAKSKLSDLLSDLKYLY